VGLREAGCRGVVDKTDEDDDKNNEAQGRELLKILVVAFL